VVLYPSSLKQLLDRWISDPGWSHGLVVPLIAVYLIRIKWETLRRMAPQRSLVGLGVLLAGVMAQLLFRATGLLPMSNLSILVVLLGGTLFVFGWEYLKLLWLPIGYLGFALPPPDPLYVAMTTPMQTIAAQLGVMLLPLFGVSGLCHGVVVTVFNGPKSIDLEVAQACSGMRMLVAFFALAVALGYSANRPMWQKVFLAACALPIAIFCNAMRVTLTGVMGVHWGQQWAGGTAHEYTGLLMLIPAMGMQWVVGWVLDHLFIEVPETAAPGGGT
jgi:exosortase